MTEPSYPNHPWAIFFFFKKRKNYNSIYFQIKAVSSNRFEKKLTGGGEHEELEASPP